MAVYALYPVGYSKREILVGCSGICSVGMQLCAAVLFTYVGVGKNCRCSGLLLDGIFCIQHVVFCDFRDRTACGDT